MLYGHAIDIPAQVEGEMSHVEYVPIVKHTLQVKKVFSISDHFPREIDRKPVVPGRNGRMGCKNTAIPYRSHVLLNNRFPSGHLCRLIQKFQGQKGRMSFIKMEGVNVLVT